MYILYVYLICIFIFLFDISTQLSFSLITKTQNMKKNTFSNN